jgi:hypothetical protein
VTRFAEVPGRISNELSSLSLSQSPTETNALVLTRDLHRAAIRHAVGEIPRS